MSARVRALEPSVVVEVVVEEGAEGAEGAGEADERQAPSLPLMTFMSNDRCSVSAALRRLRYWTRERARPGPPWTTVAQHRTWAHSAACNFHVLAATNMCLLGE